MGVAGAQCLPDDQVATLFIVLVPRPGSRARSDLFENEDEKGGSWPQLTSHAWRCSLPPNTDSDSDFASQPLRRGFGVPKPVSERLLNGEGPLCVAACAVPVKARWTMSGFMVYE